MSKVQKSRSVWIDEAGLDKVRLRMAELKKSDSPDNKRAKTCWTPEYLAPQAHVSFSTVKRLLRGIPIDRDYAISIFNTLGFEPLEFIAEHDLKLQRNTKDPKPNLMIDWRLVCQEMLQEQQEEQRFRRRATEQGFEVKVFVPLGLVERKQQQRRSGILPMEEVHQLEKEVIIRTYEHDEFLKDVIGQKSANKNKHIAIVGEPGAGKTTLLDAIATHIQKNTEDLPICISLGSLQGKKLKDYILEKWLPEAIALTYPDIDVETFHQTSLQKRLRQGGVWLLLDGVDEMGETSPAKAFESIQNQLTDWLGNVRVVLTCRSNVWDAYLNNPLTSFDTYKTQHFDPADIRRFIKQWFGFAGKPELGKILRQKLNEPQRDRIRQLVENPLRLALLCQVFHKDKQAELPETKAGLYELFVRYFYEWKPRQCSVDFVTQPGLKEELHQALGRLSIAGLDSDARFRLPESLVQKEMGDRLFKLAWELGWLNLVDREATTDEPVYAFFHPTFQEYFAALAIDDNWHFFLNHDNENPYPFLKHNNKDCVYHIFEPQWKEVILLWLGRLDKNLSKPKKLLMDNLVEFNDNVKYFYRYQAFFLAAAAIAEFQNYPYSDKVVGHLVELAFSDIIEVANQQCLDGYRSHHIREIAKSALKQSKRSTVISELVRLLKRIECEAFAIKFDKEYFREESTLTVASFLLKIDPINPEAVNAMHKLIKCNYWVRESAARSLIESNSENLEAQKIWSEFEANLQVNNKKMSFYNIVSNALEGMKIRIGNVVDGKDINSLIYQSFNCEDALTVKLSLQKLGLVGVGNKKVIKAMIDLLLNSKDKWIYDQGIFRPSNNQWLRESIVNTLKLVTTIEMIPQLIKNLNNYLRNEVARKDESLYNFCHELLWHCAQNMSYPDFYRAWHDLPSNTHTEAPDNIPASNSFIVQNLTITQKIQIIQSTVVSDSTLKDTVQLICIAGSQFSDPNNPATDIYIEMIEQGCPEQQEEPSTMQQLKKYWRLRLKNLEKRVALLFYNSKSDREFSETCLTALSTFRGAIAIITDQPCENVELISPNDPDLINRVLNWLKWREDE